MQAVRRGDVIGAGVIDYRGQAGRVEFQRFQEPRLIGRLPVIDVISAVGGQAVVPPVGAHGPSGLRILQPRHKGLSM